MANLYKIFTKYGQLFAIGLGGLIALIFFLGVNRGSDQFDNLTLEEQFESNIFDFGLYAAIYLIIICAIIAVIFGIWFLINEPRRSIQLIGGLVVLIVLGFIMYATADPGFDSPMLGTLERFDISEGVSKFVSAGLSTTIILIAVAAFSIVVAEIINLFKS